MSRLVLAAFLLAAVPPVLAQSLGEAAEQQKKEKEKDKKKDQPSGKVFTNEDLAKHHVGGKPSPQPSASPSPEASEAPRHPELEEKQWRSAAAARREAIRNAEKRIAEAQAEVDRLNSGLAPFPVMDPTMYQTLEAQRQKALADLEAARKVLEQAQKAWADFEEDARRKSVPPGWLRE